jgi:hypothetical protein
MGYHLQAFLCRESDTRLLTEKFDKAVSVDIGQGLSFIPMTEELFDQLNNFTSSSSVDRFEYMTEYVEHKILNAMGDRKFAYVEAEYFGGEGGQIAIIWNNNRQQQILPFGQDKINQVLKDFGATANKGEDEFLTLGFALHRNTREWIEDAD